VLLCTASWLLTLVLGGDAHNVRPFVVKMRSARAAPLCSVLIQRYYVALYGACRRSANRRKNAGRKSRVIAAAHKSDPAVLGPPKPVKRVSCNYARTTFLVAL